MSSLKARVSLKRAWQRICQLPRSLAIGVVRFYQRGISPLIGPCCRFTPSCSQYMILAIEKYGVVCGVLRGLWRILRCNPFNVGGHDPP
jgi:putative membrane protein insertion efficiency factor